MLPHDVEVIWDGISDTSPEHIKVLKGEFLSSGRSFVDTRTANTTVSFNLNAILETDENHYSLLMGPPNHFVEGAKPMTALIRSDWYGNTSLNFCWIITTPNVPVLFKKGTPFMFLINYPKQLLERTEFKVKTMTPEHSQQIRKYAEDRKNFYAENPGMKFTNMYRKGLDGTHEQESKHIDKVYRPMPSEPIYE